MGKLIFCFVYIFVITSLSCSKNEVVTGISKDSIVTENNSEDNWTKVNIEGMGSINIPPEMEIQSGNYKKLNDKLYEILGFENKSVIFQQKGLNEFDSKGFTAYARIIIAKDVASPNSYEDLNSKYTITKSELMEFNVSLKEGLTKSYSKMNMKIVEWYPTEIVTVNDIDALLTKCERQLSDNPIVCVEMYQFQNNDRLHRITFSYRKENKDIWQPIFENVLNSISIKKID